MIVIDTSVWIEFLRQNPLYASKVDELLENREVLAVGIGLIDCAIIMSARKHHADHGGVIAPWKQMGKFWPSIRWKTILLLLAQTQRRFEN